MRGVKPARRALPALVPRVLLRIAPMVAFSVGEGQGGLMAQELTRMESDGQ